MKHIVKLRESDFHRLVRNIIMEDGLGGATSCAGVYDTAMSDGTYENGDAQRKQVTDVPLGGVIRRPPVVGEPNGKKKDTLGNDALKRKDGVGGSISVNQVESVERGEINEVNWKGLALGGMMALSPMNAANAQTQYNQSQQNTRIEQQAPMSVENAKKILQKWNSMSPLPTITKQEAQNKIFNSLSMSEYGKIDASTKLLDSILIKSNDGNFLTGKSFSLNDIQKMYNKYGNRIAIMQIDGTKYFVNIDALADWDF